MKLPHFAVILLMSLASFAQSNPTTFTNLAPAGYHPGDYTAVINTENSQPITGCPVNTPTGGCGIVVDWVEGLLAVTLPDFPGVGENIIPNCAISSSITTGRYCCTLPGCQSTTYSAGPGVIYTSTGQVPVACADGSGQSWALTVTERFHWKRFGLGCYKHIDGGSGTLSH